MFSADMLVVWTCYVMGGVNPAIDEGTNCTKLNFNSWKN